jgi:NADP-dependent 3-hydroxy acid dehydrogenase YdfG
MSKPVCLITGVGGGTGGAIAKKFGRNGYRVAMLARSPAFIGGLEQQIEDSKAYVSDVGNLDTFTETIDRVKTEMGIPEVAIHNAVRGGFSRFLEADPEDLEKNFRVNTTSLLYLARALAPDMIKAGKGAIIVTGNTSSLRGIPTFCICCN